MKHLTLLVLVLVLASCENNQDEKVDSEPEIEEDLGEVHVVSTAYEYPEFKIPENYFLDSISIYDSLTRASYSAFYLQSSEEGMTTFNSLMKLDAQAQIMKTQQYIDPYNEAFGDFEVIFSFVLKPVSFFSNPNVVSVSHIIDEYTEGGNHHNHSSYSFNYSLPKKQKVNFNDVFNLRTSEDSIQFFTTAETRLVDGGCTGWGNPTNLDFSFGEEGVFINPNLGWACSGTRSLFPWDEFRGPEDKEVIEPEME